MRWIPQRLGISKLAQEVLQNLEDVHVGAMDSDELGRMMRLSAEKRKAISDAIRKCASMMEKQPVEMKSCIVIIGMCTEIMDISNRPPPLSGFPFKKLPRELRARILGMIIDRESTGPGQFIQPRPINPCRCTNYPGTGVMNYTSKEQRLLFATLGSGLGTEFFEVMYRKKTWFFGCCCELLDQLVQNKRLFQHLCQAHVHWCGPKAAQAFRKLATCPNFQDLTIKISKATMFMLNERESHLSQFFPMNKNRRLTDILGADELLKLRGLSNVNVEHATNSQREKLTEVDRQSLWSLLLATVMQPKNHNV
ncbi:hypothetical protein CCHL11_05498 [Colletotrichum chlorophyti]|uniref:Uncharacterized protein n=1 Tax=Colletotrichum chlorophyti TaxID=708187 RepID=A0A1Q8RBT6_9PEZI|nr:hypothetical protein CCHL11_05498 [Colletotrichum chlorophyti]